MPDDIAIKIDAIVNADNNKSLKDLKKDFSDLNTILSETKEGTKNYQKALEALGKTKDDIGDLKAKINALNPEGKVAAFGNLTSKLAGGFAAAQGAAALFGKESDNVQKALLKVQAAMALSEGIKSIAGIGDAFQVLKAVILSNPLFLIAALFIAIGVALYALKDKFKIIGDTFEAIGLIIDYISEKITEFTDAIGLTNSALDKMGDRFKMAAEKATAALAKQTQAYDDQIAVAKAAGKSTVDLEIAKQNAIIETNKKIVEQIIAFVRAGGTLDEERKKLLTQSLDDIRKAKVSEQVIEATDKKDKGDKYKKHLEDKAKTDEEAYQAERIAKKKKEEAEIQEQIDSDAYFAAIKKDSANKEKEKEFTDQQNTNARLLIESAQQAEQEIADENETNKKKREARAKLVEDTLLITEKGLIAAKGVTDLYFQLQLNKAKGNAAAELAIRKKQFKVDQAFNVAKNIIDTVRGITSAIASNPYPLNVALAVATGILGTANTAKILATKFDGGSPDTGGGGNVSGINVSENNPAPIIPQPNNNTTALPDSANEKQQTIKAIVVETDITQSQKRINTIKETATIG